MRRSLGAHVVTLVLICAGSLSAHIGEIDVNAGPPAERAAKTEQDQSTLWIISKTRVTLIVSDNRGRRTGVDPKTKKVLQEIPGSTCEVDFVKNKYTQEEAVEAYERITIAPSPSMPYRFKVLGLQDGPFEIDISALSRDGSSEPGKQVEGIISEAAQKSFVLTYDASPQSLISVFEGH
jgi:hypothetical protein